MTKTMEARLGIYELNTITLGYSVLRADNIQWHHYRILKIKIADHNLLHVRFNL